MTPRKPRTKRQELGYPQIRLGRGEKKAIELPDQTNLLPTKQVVFVFMGLTCALFCSLLDQTMCVSFPHASSSSY